MKKSIITEDRMNQKTIILHPDWRQFVINELPTLLFTVAMYVVGGLDCIPFASVFFCMALASTFQIYYCFVYLKGMTYTIGDEQLIYEHGVFTRSRDYIELYRVIDYDEHRSFMQQLMGLKNIRVHSGDRTTPMLDIIGVREDMELVRLLRERVSYNRKRMNIHEFANYI